MRNEKREKECYVRKIAVTNRDIKSFKSKLQEMNSWEEVNRNFVPSPVRGRVHQYFRSLRKLPCVSVPPTFTFSYRELGEAEIVVGISISLDRGVPFRQ